MPPAWAFILLLVGISLWAGLNWKLNQLLALARATKETMMSALDDLTAQVTANTDTEASAVQAIQNIAAALAAAGTDPVKLAALQTQLKTSADALAAAIVANTPAA